MIKSMTGFGMAEGEVGGARVVVELRSVNHRFFSANVKLPGSLSRWESEIREALRKSVGRGHVTIGARLERGPGSPVHIDEELFASYVTRLKELRSRYELGGEIDLGVVLRMPDVITSEERDVGTPAELMRIVDSAIASLDEMRRAEGERLADDLRSRLQTIEQAIAELAARAPQRVVEQRERLVRAVAEISEGVALDEQRLAQEIAILADRIDIQEELTRFGSHLVTFRGAIDGPPPEGVGKRLGFLLQEMLREANTMGSKANDVQITGHVLRIKEELERIREQVENLE
jgi:uncharacterized protein (TIGR00255 family)